MYLWIRKTACALSCKCSAAPIRKLWALYLVRSKPHWRNLEARYVVNKLRETAWLSSAQNKGPVDKHRQVKSAPDICQIDEIVLWVLGWLYECLKLQNNIFNPIISPVLPTSLTTWLSCRTTGDHGQLVISPTLKNAKNAVVHIALNKYILYSLEHTKVVWRKILRRTGSVAGKRVSKSYVTPASRIPLTLQRPKIL